jgi:hypothetical protein
MTEFAPAEVTASVSRALWGEVCDKLRSVQFRMTGRRIDLRFFFDGSPNDDELDSVASMGAEVAADFPDSTVSEEVVPTQADSAIPHRKGWHTAYTGKEATLAR